MGPKKRRQQNNKENVQLDPLSIQSIIDENLEKFEANFNKEYRQCEEHIQEKLACIHREFDRYMQTHQTQNRLARLLDQEITRINQQQTSGATLPQCQELLDKTTDLMNASTSDSSRTKTYLIGELQMLPLSNGNQ